MKDRLILLASVVALLLLFVSLINTNKSNKSKVVRNTSAQLAAEHALSEANKEWLNRLSGVKKGLLESMEITTVVSGEVQEVILERGRLEGLEHYYTVEKGGYTYDAGIRLKGGENESTFYLSPRRTELLEVYDGNQEITLADIKVGDRVELTETVDLSQSSINDKNVLQITIRVLE